MVIQTTINGTTAYLHSAWATDENGADFSLTQFDEAEYVGNIINENPAEETDPALYKWLVIDEDIVAEDDIEDDTENAEPVQLASIDDSVDDLSAASDSITAQTIINDSNIQGTQNTSDEGLGNVNELINTNKGTEGWTGTVSAFTEQIYSETGTMVDCVRISGGAYAYFNADELREKLADLNNDNAYTFSADIRMSEPFAMPVKVCDIDGSNAQIIFADVTNQLIDMVDYTAAGVWVHNKSTALVTGVPVSGQVLLFDLSNMPEGATVDIGNLKIEGGAMATPWRESLAEINGSIDDALAQIQAQLTYDVFQQYGLQQTTLTVVVRRAGIDIHEQFPESLFSWHRKTEDGLVQIGTGYSITIDNDDMDFGGVILSRFTIDESMIFVLPDGNYLIFPDGSRLCLNYKGVY